jgi:hypothetical protein
MPLALGNYVSNFEEMDLITPNRLLLGRNNERSPVGSNQVSVDPKKIITTNNEIFNPWFENWLVSHVPKLIYQPKWFKNEFNLQIGDIILFLKIESVMCQTYQFGMIKELFASKDGKIRKARILYKNHNENTQRDTIRAVRELIVIHHVDETDIMEEINIK